MNRWKEDGKKLLTPGVIRWNCKLLLGVGIFFAAAVGLSALLDEWSVLRGFSSVFSNTSAAVQTPAQIFSFIGIHNTIAIVLVVCYILGQSQGMRINPATIRDFFAVYFFSAFSSMLLFNLGGVHPQVFLSLSSSIDLTLIAGFLMAFMIVGMSNFGGLLESGRFVGRELAIVVLLVALGSLPGLLAESFSMTSISEFLFQVVIIHFIGVLLKIAFFPAAILGSKIRSETGALLLGLLVLFAGLPVAALVVSGLFSAVYYITGGLITGTGVTTSLPLSNLFLPFQVPAAFISHIVRSGPVPAVFFFLSLMYYLTGFGKQYPEMIQKAKISSLEGAGQDSFDINRTRISWLFLLLGIPALVFTGLWIGLDSKGQRDFISGQRFAKPRYSALDAIKKRSKPLWIIRGKKEVSPQSYYRIWSRAGRVFTFFDDGDRSLVSIHPDSRKKNSLRLGDDYYVRYSDMHLTGRKLHFKNRRQDSHLLLDTDRLKMVGWLRGESSADEKVAVRDGILYRAGYSVFTASHLKGSARRLYAIQLNKTNINGGRGLHLDGLVPIGNMRCIGARLYSGIYLFGPKGYRRLHRLEESFVKMFVLDGRLLLVTKGMVKKEVADPKHGDIRIREVPVLRFTFMDLKTFKMQAGFSVPFPDLKYVRIRKVFRIGNRWLVVHEKSRVLSVDLIQKKISWSVNRRFARVRVRDNRVMIFSGFSGDLEIFNRQTGKLQFARNLGRLHYLLGRGVEEYDFMPFVLQDRYLYCNTGRRRTVAKVDLKSGKTVWESEILPHFVCNGIAVAGDRVVAIDMRQNVYVYRRDK